MAPLLYAICKKFYWWGPKSERVVSDVPHGHWQTTTFVGALRTSGMTAPMVIDGAMKAICSWRTCRNN